MFAALEGAMQNKRLALQPGPAGVSTEQVLVFETSRPVKEFVEAIRSTEGLAWLAEDELADIDPDADFYVVDDDKQPTDKKLTARVYMVLTNQTALAQLLSLWKLYTSAARGIGALKPWRAIFKCLREIRPWGVKDRLEETRVLDRWEADIAGGSVWVQAEIQLWFKADENARAAATARILDLVSRAGGRQLGREAVIPEIEYHALLVDLPAELAQAIVQKIADIELVSADEVRFFRPMPQMIGPSKTRDAHEADRRIVPPDHLGPPLVALLDGLPIENHGYLKGRLLVDDPDGFAADYPAGRRHHGTSMASLILHGDLAEASTSSDRQLYVRPILTPSLAGSEVEVVPKNQLWVDLVYRSVRRIVEGDNTDPAVAPTVRIVNLSVADTYQPFMGSMSPMARLIDWLAWKYQLLFVVSAGNYSDPPAIPSGARNQPIGEQEALKALFRDHRKRRLLAPAEAINALTVGACHEDQVHDWVPPSPEQQTLLSTPGLPSPFSAVGRGFRKAVKPEVLAPGGRAVFIRRPARSGTEATFERAHGPTLPGQQVASPGRLAGDINSVSFTRGTSNAAALTSRLAATTTEVVVGLQLANPENVFARLPPALVAKALVVHTARWNRDAFEALASAIRTKENNGAFRDLVSAYLGYGCIDPTRAVDCTEQRATFLSGGFISPDEQWDHTVPIPSCLHAQACWRRLTITLAWFTPIAPRSRPYRGLRLSFDPRDSSSVLQISRQDVHGRAVSRGTVQHEVLEGASTMNVWEDAALKIPVACFADALPSERPGGIRVPYALAVSLEVAPKTGLPIYEQVQVRIQPRIRVFG